ncbi:hypothetical protein KAH37_01120 [bacterium]|nr:hypothetical protein [bacterium]
MKRFFVTFFLLFLTLSVAAKQLDVAPTKQSPWDFAGIHLGLGTSFTVGITIARYNNYKRHIVLDLGRVALGPGFLLNRDSKEYYGDSNPNPNLILGLAFEYELAAIGRVFSISGGNKYHFGIMLGFGGKFIYDIRESGWNNPYIDWLPFRIFLRTKTKQGNFEVGIRVPLIWMDGVYYKDNDLTIYKGMPDLMLTFSYF